MGSRQKFVANVVIPLAGVATAIILVVALVTGLRWLSQATMRETISNPRPGVECLTVMSNDNVAVSCYLTAGLPPKAA